MEKIPTDVERAAVTDQLPSSIERRLVLRCLAYWKLIRDERNFPSLSDIDPADIPDIWPHCLILDLTHCPENPVFRTVGGALTSHVDGSLIDRRVSDIERNTLIGAAVGYFDEVLDKGVPVSRGGEFRSGNGTNLLYRSIILPMSDDGETISELLVALNFRGVGDEETTEYPPESI